MTENAWPGFTAAEMARRRAAFGAEMANARHLKKEAGCGPRGARIRSS